MVVVQVSAPTHPAWYRNLVTHSEVTVEVNGETFKARDKIPVIVLERIH